MLLLGVLALLASALSLVPILEEVQRSPCWGAKQVGQEVSVRVQVLSELEGDYFGYPRGEVGSANTLLRKHEHAVMSEGECSSTRRLLMLFIHDVH